MIRAVCPDAVSDLKTGFVTGWNVSPNIAYTITVVPGASSCAVWLFDAATGAYLAGGAALVGTDQPVTLLPATSPGIGMVDTDLGYHLLVSTDGTEDAQTYGIGPFVDGSDQLSAIYTVDDLAVVQATAVIREGTHYTDDASIMCPLGFDGLLGDIVSTSVHGSAIVGDIESASFQAGPSSMADVITIRSMSAILPDAPVVIVPPTVADDIAETDASTAVTGYVLTNDSSGLTVVAVDGIAANVGVAVPGNNGGVFAIAADGSWTFDPDGDFSALSGSDTAETSVTYHASNGSAEAMATLAVTVSHANADPYWASVVSLLQPPIDAADESTAIVDAKGRTLTLNGGTCVKTTLGYPAFYFDGVNNSIVLDSHASFAFGTGNFTLDLLLYPLAYGGTVCGPSFWGTTNGSTAGYVFHLGQDVNSMRVTSKLTGTWADNLSVSAGGGPALNTLTHIAMERYGDTLTLYKNGAIVAQRTGVAAFNFAAGQIIIGRFWDGPNSRYLNGYIRAIRATAAARWQGLAFSGIVPSYPYPES